MAMRIAATVGVIAVLTLIGGEAVTVIEETDGGLFPYLIRGAPHGTIP